MLEAIGLNNLRIFYAVAKVGNITRAANELFISQPAVTQAIKKIEQSLKFSLFLRSKKGVVLTNVGKELFDRLSQVFDILDATDNFLKQLDDLNCGEIVYGGSSYIIRKMFSKKVKGFACLHPNIKLTQVDDTQEVMLKRLRLGAIDFVVSQHLGSVDDLKFIPLFNEEFMFVCSKNYKNRSKNDKNCYIFQGEGTYNQKIMTEILQKHQIDCTLCHKVVGYNMALELCGNDMGIAMLPKSLCEKELSEGAFVQVHEDFVVSPQEYGIYVNEKNLTKACRVFLKECIGGLQF